MYFPGVTDAQPSGGRRRAETAHPHGLVLPTQRDTQSKEAQGRGPKVPEGVRDGAPGHVVHRLPLEEGLPEVHWLRARASRPRLSLLPAPSTAGLGKCFSFRTKYTWSPGKALSGTLVELQQKKSHNPHDSCWKGHPERLWLFYFLEKSTFFAVCLGLKTGLYIYSNWINKAHFT